MNLQEDGQTEEKTAILIVDDNEINRMILSETFRDQDKILEAENGKEALDLIRREPGGISAILLDIVMPEMDGLELLEILYKDGLTESIPVFLITADSSEQNTQRGYQLGAMDIIEKPIVPYFVKKRVGSVVELFHARKRLSNTVHKQHQRLLAQEMEIYELNNAIIETLSTAIEFRSGESGAHVKRIRELTGLFLRRLMEIRPEKYQFSEDEIEMISLASIMHDVGKIAIPDHILNKPGKLTKEEFEVMKQHTLKGCDLLCQIPKYHQNPLYQYAYDICRHHHERWDGKGYPDALKGDETTIWSQVVALADVYDALTNERVYKPAYSAEKAASMIVGGECGCFYPELLECLTFNLKDTGGSI